MATVLSNIAAMARGTANIVKVYRGTTLVFDKSGQASAPTINGAPTQFIDGATVITASNFSHTAVSGNKLLVVAVGGTRDLTLATPSITFNGASPNATGLINSTTGDGRPQVGWALFDSPASGANAVNVNWSSSVKETSVFAVNIANAGAVLTQANGGTNWSSEGDHDITVAAANSLVLGILAGRGTDVFSGANSSNMTVNAYAGSSAASTTAMCLGLFSASDPGAGAFSCDMNFTNTGSDWVVGLSLEIGAA